MEKVLLSGGHSVHGVPKSLSSLKHHILCNFWSRKKIKVLKQSALIQQISTHENNFQLLNIMRKN